MSQPRRLAFGFVTLLVATTWLAAQPPRKEEEEEPPAKEKARPVVPVPVEPDKKETAPKAPEPFDPEVGTFDEELKKADAFAKELFRNLRVPYDRIQPNSGAGLRYKIELLHESELPDGEFTVNLLDSSLKKVIETKKIAQGNGFTYTPFELVVLEEVDKYLAKDSPQDRGDRLEAAVRAVAAGLRWHLHARDTNKRTGKGWDAVAA